MNKIKINLDKNEFDVENLRAKIIGMDSDRNVCFEDIYGQYVSKIMLHLDKLIICSERGTEILFENVTFDLNLDEMDYVQKTLTYNN